MSKANELTRCSKTMTEAQYLAFIRSCLRAKWLRWKPRGDTLQLAKRKCTKKGQQKFEYECAICGGFFPAKIVEVDHYPISAGSIKCIEDVGKFCSHLFCEINNLRVVCKPCHALHTLSERNGITFEQATKKKKEIEFDKLNANEQKTLLTQMKEERIITFELEEMKTKASRLEVFKRSI